MTFRSDIGCHSTTTWAKVAKTLRQADPVQADEYINARKKDIHTLAGLFAYLDTIHKVKHLGVIQEHLSLIKNLDELLQAGSRLKLTHDRHRLYITASQHQFRLSDEQKQSKTTTLETLRNTAFLLGNDAKIILKLFNANKEELSSISDLRYAMTCVMAEVKADIALLKVDLLMGGGLDQVIDLIPEKDLIRVVEAMDGYAKKMEDKKWKEDPLLPRRKDSYM